MLTIGASMPDFKASEANQGKELVSTPTSLSTWSRTSWKLVPKRGVPSVLYHVDGIIRVRRCAIVVGPHRIFHGGRVSWSRWWDRKRSSFCEGYRIDRVGSWNASRRAHVRNSRRFIFVNSERIESDTFVSRHLDSRVASVIGRCNLRYLAQLQCSASKLQDQWDLAI